MEYFSIVTLLDIVLILLFLALAYRFSRGIRKSVMEMGKKLYYFLVPSWVTIIAIVITLFLDRSLVGVLPAVEITVAVIFAGAVAFLVLKARPNSRSRIM